MTNKYAWVAWNKHKKVYDAILIASVLLFIVVYTGLSFALADNPPDPVVVLMRAFASAAIVLLHVILCVGPLSRLSSRFNALLYNRRHMGVTMFGLALLHAVLVLFWYGAFGDKDPITAMFDGRSFLSVRAFPWESLGMLALLILFLMAATSHDFWLKNLAPSAWKALHMGVYVAYAAIIAHVALGALQDNRSPIVLGLVFAGLLVVGGLHVAAGLKEAGRDAAAPSPTSDDEPWVKVASADDIPTTRGKVVCLAGGERVAIFNHNGKLSAMSNVCAHQGGPLGEGKIVDGCVTCPWHGYQYLPENGQSPPPYDEKIPTYAIRVRGRDIYLDPRPLPPGTPVEPALLPATADDDTELFEPVADRAPISDPNGNHNGERA